MIMIYGIMVLAVVFTSAIFAVREAKQHMKHLYEGKEDEN